MQHPIQSIAILGPDRETLFATLIICSITVILSDKTTHSPVCEFAGEMRSALVLSRETFATRLKTMIARFGLFHGKAVSSVTFAERMGKNAA